MEPSKQPAPADPYELRPEERTYVFGWILWAIGGAYFVYRGFDEQRYLFMVGGLSAILLGLSQAAVIVIRQLRPWRKVVRITWTVVILIALAVVYTIDLLGHPILRW